MANWEQYHKELEDVDPNNFLDHHIITKTTDESTYDYDTQIITTFFQDINDVIEVGGGYGGLCKRLRPYVKRYTLIDHETMIRLANSYLKNLSVKVDVIENKDNYVKDQFDLFICNSCLSEISKEDRQYIYDNFFKNCYRIFMINGGPPEFKQELLDNLNDFQIRIETYDQTKPNIQYYVGIKK